MLSSLNRRFSDVESNESLVLATLLNPCFEVKFFSGIVERAHAKTLLETKLSKTRTTTTSLSTDPPEKRARTDVMKVFDEIINEASADVSVVSGNALQHPTRVVMPMLGGRKTDLDLCLSAV